jgi:hypothetical protein
MTATSPTSGGRQSFPAQHPLALPPSIQFVEARLDGVGGHGVE